MFPYGTVFRFYPEEEEGHYTAIVFHHNGTIKEVGAPELDRAAIYPSLQDWLASLPYENVTVDHLYVNKKRHTKKINVPPHSNRATLLNFGWYVHEVLKTYVPHLLHEVAVVDAYNAFVSCLVTYSSRFVFYFKKDDLKYIRQIAVRSEWGEMSARFSYNGGIGLGHYEWTNSVNDIRDHYMPLYNLIKGDLSPIMKEKENAYHVVVMIPIWKKQLIYLIGKQIKQGDAYNAQMEKRLAAYDMAIADINSSHDARIHLYQEKYEKKLKSMQDALEAICPDLPEKRRTKLQLTQQKKILLYQEGYTARMVYHVQVKDRKIHRYAEREQAIIAYMERKHSTDIDRIQSRIGYYSEQIKKSESCA